MPARVITLYMAVVAFLGLKISQPASQKADERLADVINTSYDSWVERGWVEKPR